MHLSFASPWVDSLDIPGEPTGTQGKWHSFVCFFFPAGEGICLVLETTSHDHGDIPTGFDQGTATGTVKNTLPGTMVDVWKWEKSVEKNSIYLFVLFANVKKVNINFGLTIKGWRRLLYYSWQLAKDIMLWVFILPPRKGLFVVNFMPFTQGLWMVFICHEKQPSGCVPGVAHGEANDKSTISLNVQ